MASTALSSRARRPPPPSSVASAVDGERIVFSAMGTHCQMRVCAPSPAIAEDAAALACAEVRRLEAKYSRYQKDSVVSRINSLAGTGEVLVVDAETARLLDFAAQLHASSDGLFDATSGILRRAWDFASGRLPEAAEVAALLSRVGWQHVAWDGCAIGLTRAGMELDFGGFAKEYAADCAAEVLLANGATGGTVNLGGDVRIAGPRLDGRPWNLGVSHPRYAGTTIAGLQLKRGALATSGNGERYMEVDGRRYCHILDPRTGWPVDAWQSVSVAAVTCLAAGALSTIAMLKTDDAHAFLREQGVGFLTVDRDGHLVQESV